MTSGRGDGAAVRRLSHAAFVVRLGGMDQPQDDRVEQVWADFVSVLDALPPTTRAVFLLHVLFEADCNDIERTLGVQPAVCAQHLGRARRAIASIPKGDFT